MTENMPTMMEYLDRPVQFIVMRIGNTSTNSAPQLQLPPQPLMVTEDTPLPLQLQYTDAESDQVDFRLESTSSLGNVTLTSSGLLTYDPCQHCTGTDTIGVSIRERPFGENHTPLEDSGQIIFQITNVNDPPLLYFYLGNSSDATESSMMSVNIDSNRSIPAVVVSVAALDFDGYADDLQFMVTQDGQFGSVGFQTRLDAVGIIESLPFDLVNETNPDLSTYYGYVTFFASHVTYLPSDPNFTGNDTIVIVVRDSSSVQSRVLSIEVEVLPSLCENNGVCGGSVTDPMCQDLARRRVSFDGYNCSCPAGFGGELCNISLSVPPVLPTRGTSFISS